MPESDAGRVSGLQSRLGRACLSGPDDDQRWVRERRGGGCRGDNVMAAHGSRLTRVARAGSARDSLAFTLAPD